MGSYEGKLKKRISKQEIREKAENAGGVDAAIRQIYLERLRLLFEHYGINPKEKGSSAKLARALMEDHVPGFQFTKAGRPKQRQRLSLHAIAGLQRPPKKPGRPRKHLDDDQLAFIQAVEDEKRRLGDGATDKAALESLHGRAIDQADQVLRRRRSAHRRRAQIAEQVKRDQKRLSEARKKFQKPAKKSRR